MPRNVIGSSPFPLETLELDRPITLEDIRNKLGKRMGVSLCVRSLKGHENRGGYFFHIEKDKANYRILNFKKDVIGILSPEQLVRFVNHVSGRQFDEEMLLYCQAEVNFKQDQNEDD
jgi:hypothetical protein